jgi:TP901 family phage tail tape measure protein
VSASAVRMGAVFVEIGARTNKLFKGLSDANRRIGQFGANLRSVGTRMMASGAAMAAPLVLAARTFASFDDAIRATAAVTGATGASLQSLADRARMLGETTSFTAVQVANLMTELGRAGFKPDEINAMTGAVLDLARATGTDATLSAGIMAATLRQFSLGASDAARVADVLTYAANNSFNTVEGLGESLKYAGPVAKSLGMSLEDTVAVLGVLGNVGIQGSEAGTALRRLSVIAAGSGEELKSLFGISNTDANGELKTLMQILDEINTVTANMPVAERTAKMAKAFGLLGITSANVLSGSADSVRDFRDGMNDITGVSERTAKSMDAGLGGSARIAMSSIEGLQLSIGEALAPTLMNALEVVTNLARGFSEFARNNQELVVGIAKGVAVFTAVGAAILSAGVALSVFSFVVAPLLSPIVLIVGAIAALVGGGLALAGVFDGLGAIFSTTLGGMYDALAGGDLAGAMDILWLGLEAGWLRGVANFMTAFEPFIDLLINAFGYLTANVLTEFDLIGRGMEATFDDIETIYRKSQNFLSAAFKGADAVAIEDNAIDNEMAARRADRDRRYGRDRFAEADAAADARNANSDAANFRAAADEAEAALQGRGESAAARRADGKLAADLLKNIEKAKTIDQLRDLYGEYDALSSNGNLSAAQSGAIEDALDDAQMRISKASSSMGGAAGITAGAGAAGVGGDSQAEVVGTFSSNVAGMGFGSSLQQQMVDYAKRTAEATETLADEGAAAATA